MFGSMGTKGGIVLYHIGYGGYGITLGCFTISGGYGIALGCISIHPLPLNHALMCTCGFELKK